MDALRLPGVSFRTIYFKPFSGRTAGRLVQGVQYFFTDYEAARITEVQFHVMEVIATLYPDRKPFEVATGIGLFDKVCGSSYIRETFSKSYDFDDIRDFWRKDEAAFRKLSSKYHLYK